jgi:hypothetical protein
VKNSLWLATLNCADVHGLTTSRPQSTLTCQNGTAKVTAAWPSDCLHHLGANYCTWLTAHAPNLDLHTETVWRVHSAFISEFPAGDTQVGSHAKTHRMSQRNKNPCWWDNFITIQDLTSKYITPEEEETDTNICGKPTDRDDRVTIKICSKHSAFKEGQMTVQN